MTALLIGAVGLAFADASVVALALPDLYGEFDTSIVGVSWVLTTYALVVAVVAVPVALLPPPGPPAVAGRRRRGDLRRRVARGRLRRRRSRCCSSPGPAQGVGATLLLAGSLPVLGAIVPRAADGTSRARRWWALAGAVGAAIGPALGGVLTELFDWRAIFFVQAPIVAGALVVAVDPAARALRREGHVHGEPGTRRRDVIVANIGFALVFAALVAALFLGVLLAIEVWRYSPIAERRARQRAAARDARSAAASRPRRRSIVAVGGAAAARRRARSGWRWCPGAAAGHGRGRVRGVRRRLRPRSTRCSTAPPSPPTVRRCRPARCRSAPATPGSCSAWR